MAFKRIKDWLVSITSFRTGDVIPVDGPDGTAKMSKVALLQLTAQNALESALSMENITFFAKEVSFELGDITSMTTTGWNYSDSDIRVRTATNNYVKLSVGDKICVKYPGRVRIYVLAHNLDGTTTSSGWLTDEFEAQKDCRAAFVIVAGSEGNLNSIPDGVNLYDYFTSNVYVVIGGKKFAFSQNSLSNDKINDIRNSKRIVLTSDFFELGNISISNSGWVYSDSTTRIRLKKNLTLVLDKGDAIVFGTTVNRYVGIKNVDTGEYSYVGWIFSGGITEFVAKFKCEIVVLFDTSDFSEIVNFKVNPYTYASLVKRYADIIDSKVFPYIELSAESFENGTINVDGSAPEYSNYLESKRIRTKYGLSLDFKKGEELMFVDVSHGKYLGVTESNGTFHKVTLGVNDTKYVLPYDAKVVFFVSFGESVTPSDMTGVFVSVGVLQRSLFGWIDFCNTKIYKNKPTVIDAQFKPIGPVGVAHRGYSSTCPENTMPAFKKAVRQGFKAIETDVRLTSDGVFVLLHDSTVDRTSNGSGSISSMTYTQVEALDFGSWKDASFSGTKIGRLDDFLDFCKSTGVFPFLEILFAQNSANMSAFVSLIKAKGLWGRCLMFSADTSSTYSYFKYMTALQDPIRFVQPIGVFLDAFTVTDDVASSAMANTAKTLVSIGFVVVAVISSSALTADMVNFLEKCGIYIDVYTVDDASDLIALNPCVKFITSDNLNAEEILKNNAIN